MSATTAASTAVRMALDRVDWDFADENPSTPSMRLNGVHWYPATFVAPLIGTMLDILVPEGRANVMDPFCGSGTAPLEAWYRGHAAFGVDSNAFAVRLSRARAKLVREGTARQGEQLSASFGAFVAGVQANHKRAMQADRAGINPEAERWFVQAALADISLAKSWIEIEAPERWRTTLRVLLSSLLKRGSRVRDYHYTYIVDRSRVKKPSEADPELAQQFAGRLKTAFRAGANMRAALLQQGTIDLENPPSFKRTQASNLSHVADGEIDVILTSPPYFGMNDYVRSQYLTWLVYPDIGFDRDLELESGSRRTRTSKPALRRYFEDMEGAFQECKRVLRPGGLMTIFLGHSQSRLAREEDVVGKLARSLKALDFASIWKGERKIRFRKITSTPSSSEHVWILRRTER